MSQALKNLWFFSRPHTIIATTIQVLVGAAMVLATVPHFSFSSVLSHALLMIFAGLGLNIFVVGINQMSDVEIDRINKPELPLASGAFSMAQATGWVVGGGLVSLLASFYLGTAWALGVSLILLLGTLYSCEPFRLKKHAIWAGLTIAVCRGVIFNLATYATWWGLYKTESISWAPAIAFCMFMFAFVLSIGVFKDLPDYEGDKLHDVKSYAVRFGLQNSFHAGVGFLSLAYLALILASGFGIGMEKDLLFSGANVASLVVLVVSAMAVKNFQKAEFVRFYRVIWGLFYFGLGSFSLLAVAG